MKKLLINIIKLFIGAFSAIILPTLLLGGITYWIEQSFGMQSIIGYIWLALVWWLSLNFIKNVEK